MKIHEGLANQTASAACHPVLVQNMPKGTYVCLDSEHPKVPGSLSWNNLTVESSIFIFPGLIIQNESNQVLPK